MQKTPLTFFPFSAKHASLVAVSKVSTLHPTTQTNTHRLLRKKSRHRKHYSSNASQERKSMHHVYSRLQHESSRVRIHKDIETLSESFSAWNVPIALQRPKSQFWKQSSEWPAQNPPDLKDTHTMCTSAHHCGGIQNEVYWVEEERKALDAIFKDELEWNRWEQCQKAEECAVLVLLKCTFWVRGL